MAIHGSEHLARPQSPGKTVGPFLTRFSGVLPTIFGQPSVHASVSLPCASVDFWLGFARFRGHGVGWGGKRKRQPAS